MTGEIPHSQNGHEPAEVQQKKDFPVTASAAHYMVGLSNQDQLKDLVRTSGLPLTKVRMGGYFYMQSELDALLAWKRSQSTDNPMPSLNGQKSERKKSKSPNESTNHTSGGTERPLPLGKEIDLSETASSSNPERPRKRLRRPRGGTIIPAAPEGFVHLNEAIKILGASSATWYHTVQLDYVRLGKSRFYRREEVEALKKQWEERKIPTKRVEVIPDGYISREEAFEIMKISSPTWYNLDRPAAIKVGRKAYFKREDIEALVNERFEKKPRQGLIIEGKLNLYQVLERLKISRNTFARRVADGTIQLAVELIQGGQFYNPAEVEQLAEKPDLFIKRRKRAHIPDGYIAKERFLRLMDLTASQWGALNRNFEFDALAAGGIQYFRESEVPGLKDKVREYRERKENERAAARQARELRRTQRSDRAREAREARESEAQARREERQKEREQKQAEKDRAKAERQEQRSRRRTTRSGVPRAASVPKPKSASPGKAPQRVPNYSAEESKKNLARNKTRELALGECVHHYIVEFDGGLEKGRCKKCGSERFFDNKPKFAAGKKRTEPGEYRPPSEMSDSDIRILDLALSGISMNEIAAQFGYKVESIRSVISKHIEAKGGNEGLAKGIKGILGTGFFEPSFSSDLESELNELDIAYLDAVAEGSEDTFFQAQGEGFNARKLRDELRTKMGLENDIAPIVWRILQTAEAQN